MSERYGRWAGCPQGQEEDTACCIASIVPDELVAVGRQCNRKRGHGKGGLYCKQHDPAFVAAKKAAWNDAFDSKQAKQDRIVKEAKTLAKRLGVRGDANYNSLGPYRNCGYTESLVIPFADVRKLIDRLTNAGL